MQKGWQDFVDMESISFWPVYTHAHTVACLRPCLSLSFPPLVYSVACDHLDLTCIVAELVSFFCALSLSLFCYCLSLISRLYNLPKKKEKRVSEWWKDKSSVSFWRGLLLHKKKQPPNNFSSMFNSKSFSPSAFEKKSNKALFIQTE